jgi:acyl-CoA dehydrogenase
MRTRDALHVTLMETAPNSHGHNLVGEPRATFPFDVAVGETRSADVRLADELMRRGAWARCNQIMGALDAACELTVAHTAERVQFGRQLHNFQAVQHSLAAMAGEIERARATTALAVAAAADYGFDHAATDYAVTVAKVTVGRAVDPVTTIAHQLHGAIGVTAEHRLWLSTMRARSWVDEFGTTGSHARRLGRLALAADDPWDVVVSCPAPR